MKARKIRQFLILLIATFLLFSCNNENNKIPDVNGFIYSDDELLNEKNTGLKSVKIESDKFKQKVDSVIKSKFKNAQIIDLVLYHPVSRVNSDVSNVTATKAFIDSNSVGSEVIFLNNQDTIKWLVMFMEGRMIFNRKMKD